MSVFETLNAINVNDKTEKKGHLTYLSWAWAWGEVKKKYPNAFYTVYENPQGFNYFTDGRTCWVKTGVTIEGLEHIEYLPVMDNRNNAIPLEKVSCTDINKSIQRSITKACARHGLGLYIYAGEDLPEDEQSNPIPQAAPIDQTYINTIRAELKRTGWDENEMLLYVSGRLGSLVKRIEDIPFEEAVRLLQILGKRDSKVGA
nr:MAG TPA: Protein of unknown function (DUF1071) [Caudoviricetes sp.]